MLELFFDNKKVFSVFERILKNKSTEINYPQLTYGMGISAEEAADILQSFVFLGILKETENTFETGIFEFNPTSEVVLHLCLFDEVVGRYAFKKIKDDFFNDGEDDDFKSFQAFLETMNKSKSDSNAFEDLDEILKRIKENGL